MGTYQDLYDKLKNDPEALQVAIEDAVTINREVVLVDLLRQAQVFMTWGYLLALAETDAKRLKLNMEEDVLPAARVKAHAELKEAGEKVTITAKDDIAKQDPSYKQIQAMFITATQRSAIYRKVVDALDHKLAMLQSLNSRQKVELGALPEDDAMFQQRSSPRSEYAHVAANKTNADASDPNHGTVEEECADLARKYRSKRREKRIES